MVYQTFPWELGNSQSFQKLHALHLPSLEGKTVLDVGCNEGFFCGYAAFQKARYVLGVDKNRSFLAKARKYFPQCHFLCLDWQDLPETKFDVIIFISAIHYAEDQKAMIDFLMNRLNPDGFLILEIGLVASNKNKFVKVERSIDTRLFPTKIKFLEMVKEYAFKYIGKSVKQDGDPIERYVYHIYNKKPYAILLMDNHYSGKTATALDIFNKDIIYLNGDSLLQKICNDGEKEEIHKIYKKLNNQDRSNSALLISCICKNNLLENILNIIVQEATSKSFILDMFIPAEHRNKAIECLKNKGFFVINTTLHNSSSHTTLDAKICKRYFDYLNNSYIIDEQAYLDANPDLAKAYAEGKIKNLQFHYWNIGRYEHRPLHK